MGVLVGWSLVLTAVFWITFRFCVLRVFFRILRNPSLIRALIIYLWSLLILPVFWLLLLLIFLLSMGGFIFRVFIIIGGRFSIFLPRLILFLFVIITSFGLPSSILISFGSFPHLGLFLCFLLLIVFRVYSKALKVFCLPFFALLLFFLGNIII